MSTYMQGTSRPDISMATHQATILCINPKLSDKRAIYRIGGYLKGIKDKGVIFKPNKDKGTEFYVGTDFASGWDKVDSGNSEAVLSRTVYVLMYANFPFIWCYKLQTKIALSTTEAKFIALSQAKKELLPFTNLMKERS